MLSYTVLNKMENGEYLVDIVLDGEYLGERTMDRDELIVTCRTSKECGALVLFKEESEEVEDIEVSIEEYDREFDVNINKWTYNSVGVSYKCEYVGSYKTLAKARKIAQSYGYRVIEIK